MGISDGKRGTTSLFSATYTGDNANQLTSDPSAPSASGSYKYKTLNQVCYAGSSSSTACATPSGATDYSYDAADNLTQTGATQQAFNNDDELCCIAPAYGCCGCFVGCLNASYQGGDVSVGGGGVGDLEKGPYAGIATKKIAKRHPVSAACSLGVGIGVTVPLESQTDSLTGATLRSTFFEGLGWQSGYMFTTPAGTLAPLN
jgi:hypothetical protein